MKIFVHFRRNKMTATGPSLAMSNESIGGPSEYGSFHVLDLFLCYLS